MPRAPSRPLFVSPDGAPDDHGWRIAHNASDAYDRSLRSAVSQSTNVLRKSRGAPDWKAYELSLKDALLSRFTSIADRVGTASRIPGVDFDADSNVVQRSLRRAAGEHARMVARDSAAAYRKAQRRLAREGITGDQAEKLLRPLRGLNRMQTQSAVNRLVAMREAGASKERIAKEASLLGRRKLTARGQTIARTAGLDAATRSQELVVQSALSDGVIEGTARMWVATLDVTHPLCARLDGQITGMDQRFVDPGTGQTFFAPPIHANCMCGVQYVVLTDEGRRIAATETVRMFARAMVAA